MSVYATLGLYAHLGDLIKQYDTPEAPAMFNDVVVVNTAAVTTLILGTVLGKITATGKYIPSVVTATDGSQNPVAIYIGDFTGAVNPTTTVAATDTNVLALVRGKVIVSKNALTFDASYSSATLLLAGYNSLKAVGILPETTI